jgi:hypothetical protein
MKCFYYLFYGVGISTFRGYFSKTQKKADRAKNFVGALSIDNDGLATADEIGIVKCLRSDLKI